jgi:beta-glucosidase
MRLLSETAKCFVALVLILCAAPASALDPWRNVSLPISERVADLISRLSLSEKASLMSSTTPAIDRFGISAFNWGTECLHGVADSVLPATVFPQPIALGASFNTTLARLIGTAISDEARALYNAGSAKFLQFFAPNMNLFRDPR